MLTLLVLLGSLPVIGLWELYQPRRRRDFPALRRRLGNIGFWALNLVLAALLLGPPAQARLQIETVLGTHLLRWPIPDAVLGVVAGFLLLDLLRYLVHRCEHAVPLFWRLHALHHLRRQGRQLR